jgi:hypothetical protein
MTRPLFIEAMKGLGDSIYQRPFIKAAASRGPVWVRTPWPELYEDLDVRFVRSGTTLRTQRLNEQRQSAARWSTPPSSCRVVTVGYGTESFRAGSILDAMERQLPLGGHPLVMDLPDMGASPVGSAKPIALVRPVTVRSEWRNEARNPLPEYVAEIAADLKRTHHVVVVAHLAQGQEWALDIPPHHQAFLRGELTTRKLLALVSAADVVVGGVGWIVPAAIAAKAPAFIIRGGQGGHNAPAKITDPRLDLSRLGWAVPDRPCHCESMRHGCDKRISDLSEQWRRWRTSLRPSRKDG